MCASGARPLLTCSHLIEERLSAVLDQALELGRTVGDREVEHAQDLLWLVEVDHLLVAPVLALDVVQTDLDDAQQELSRALAGLRVALEREQICARPVVGGGQGSSPVSVCCARAGPEWRAPNLPVNLSPSILAALVRWCLLAATGRQMNSATGAPACGLGVYAGAGFTCGAGRGMRSTGSASRHRARQQQTRETTTIITTQIDNRINNNCGRAPAARQHSAGRAGAARPRRAAYTRAARSRTGPGSGGGGRATAPRTPARTPQATDHFAMFRMTSSDHWPELLLLLFTARKGHKYHASFTQTSAPSWVPCARPDARAPPPRPPAAYPTPCARSPSK